MFRPIMQFAAMAALAAAAAGCGAPAASNPQGGAGKGQGGDSIFFISVTTDGSDDLQRLDMAMKLAGFALDEKRDVFLFFNVKGVRVPAESFDDDIAFETEPPVKEQLARLIDRGAVVHVCPVCMKALGVPEGELIEGAAVTTRAGLFSKIGSGTAVFSY